MAQETIATTMMPFVNRIRLRPVVFGLLYALLVLALFIYRFVVQAIWDVQTVFF